MILFLLPIVPLHSTTVGTRWVIAYLIYVDDDKRQIRQKVMTPEIARYIQQERKPSFKKFVEGNVVNLANWSLKLPTASSSTIHGLWFEKYCKVSMDVLKPRPRKPNTYNVMIWSEILSRVNRRKNMLDKCGEAALDIIGDVSGSVASQVSKSIMYSDGSSSLCSPDDSTNDYNAPGDTSSASILHHDTNHNSDAHGNTSDNSAEYRDLHYYGVKKLRGTFDEQDKCNVESKLTNGSSSNEKTTNHIIKLLCQPNLAPTDQETIKLLLSKIINTLDENIYATMENIFTSEPVITLEWTQIVWEKGGDHFLHEFGSNAAGDMSYTLCMNKENSSEYHSDTHSLLLSYSPKMSCQDLKKLVVWLKKWSRSCAQIEYFGYWGGRTT
ncbi:hypothetical protein BCR42DRAFT_497394 [Absidia repens]|uniref:Uncharacterized protein n=1 Tax=Absidia repens TaxID=90262 RepID=A0A1X2HDV8_9FUNG|nr:hypothetical protein BCR42DRAFT_497394 [Absidia repens]